MGKKLKEQKLQDHSGAIKFKTTKISQPLKSKNESKNQHFHAKNTLKKMSVIDNFCVNTLLKKINYIS